MPPADELERLAGHRRPLLIGVRHHSPHLAAAVGALLDAADPDVVFLELPADLQEWVRWLGHPDTVAPVALAASLDDGTQLGFWPFADFSPELAAVRWARAADVEVVAFDLPAGDRTPAVPRPPRAEGPDLLGRLLADHQLDDAGALWDRLVEAPAPGADPEALRRAGLALGWALRHDALEAGLIDANDLAREAHMRAVLAARDAERPVAVIGAFHAAALIGPDPAGSPVSAADDRRGAGNPPVVTSIIPYGFELFDSRSGYPAGVLDPSWQQRVWAAGGDPGRVEAAAGAAIVELCGALRSEGHVAGVPDATEALRMAIDLANLRGLPAPGRRELLEALTSCFGQGEPLGRGRALARAAQGVLVGEQRGRLAPGTPQSGLVPHVERLRDELGLPGPTAASVPAADLRLDVQRSPLDRRRHVALARFTACRIAYGTEAEVAGVAGVEGLTRRWTVRWTPATSAGVEVAGTRGVTLAAAAEGTLRLRLSRAERADELSPPLLLQLTAAAAEAGLPTLTAELLDRLAGPFLGEATVVDLLAGHGLVHRLRHGHVPGLPPDDLVVPPSLDGSPLLLAAVRSVDGLAGSDQVDDVRALVALTHALDADDDVATGRARLTFTLSRFVAGEASSLMEGAASALLVLLGRRDQRDLAARVGSWIDDGYDRNATAQRLRGLLAVAAELLEGSPDLLDELCRRVEALDDDGFVHRLPALRHGFEVLSPAGRGRLLEAIAERLGLDAAELARRSRWRDDPATGVEAVAADRAGRAAVEALDPGLLPSPLASSPVDPSTVDDAPSTAPPPAGGDIGPADRWRLILGRGQDQLAEGRCALGSSLDELYGRGHGEGSRHGLGPGGRGGGQEAPYPSARVWADELEALFGPAGRDEVLGRAAASGRTDVVAELDPRSVTPSVELLEQVLSLQGALPEAQLAHLRALAQRITDQLAAALARRLRPALRGLETNRPSRRPGGRVDLKRTIAANLHTARPDADGTLRLAPEHLRYLGRSRRSMDWHVVLVVDVSGSMEVSVIHSALVAAILAGLPALSVHFLAFSTEVIDLTDRVDDPLGLLLEVSVGGGTDIGRGLRAAREVLRVPSRSIVLVVSDFEEGVSVGSLLGEVRALVGSGAKVLGVSALDDEGHAQVNRAIAEQVVAAGMPVAALTPAELARWVAEQVQR